MRNTNGRLTICEVLRQINDKVQGKGFEEVRNLLALAESMAKRMDKKLLEYNKEWDKDFWSRNVDYEEKCKRELNTYLVGKHE